MIIGRGTNAGRGGILLEAIIALAIFVTVGLAVSTAMRAALTTAADLRARAEAEDIARSAIAQLRAGIADIDALDGPVPADEHSTSNEFADSPEDTPWTREIEADRSGFAGLDLVTVTVINEDDPTVIATVTALVNVDNTGGPTTAAVGGP